MAEDYLPTPKVSQVSERQPLSSVPVQLSLSEIAVVGQPGLIKYDLTSAAGVSQTSMSWVRGEDTLSSVLPVCFVANSMRCKVINTTKEIRATSNTKIYRLDLTTMVENMMYVKCEVDLCIAFLPSQTCTTPCNTVSVQQDKIKVLQLLL
ncbi:uncharacterized protein LOC133498437 isoform X2 [Syngnathoides biaculeatus]|uniref:uncharacterized protein LOC133498437 isoform X2 n=1 Tax=Syngnathoides biaculeatus TaxID=300417 RepID=UPI002ADE2E4E|nr:uncharacterized protein LOC133498437 isoform X2 [Syngnathoides biaculeatus]